jgi:hypothetical protein
MSTAASPVAPPAPGSAVTNRNRQIVYALAILLLFVAMFPYTLWLNDVKKRRELGEATIGQVDTGSFMLKLALLGGARGVAANTLWTRAIELQKLHEWDKLEQTVNLITKLQPHFLSIWTFQSWNLAYNVSVEWDDPADKYEWIKRGIKFIRQGTEKNRKQPDLLWDTAWTYYHKLGFADESVILRRLFYDDTDEDFKIDILRLDDEHIRSTVNDNFEAAHGWFTRAVRLVDSGATRTSSGVRESAEGVATDIQYVDRPVQRKGRGDDLNFRTMPAHASTRFAIAQEKMSIKGIEPKFGEAASRSWQQANDEWLVFGNHKFPAFNFPGVDVQLEDIFHIDTLDQGIAEAAAGKPKEKAEARKYWTDRWSNDTNYRYWRSRSMAESQKSGVEGRRLFYEATRALKSADFQVAADKYKSGLQLWKDLLAQYPAFSGDMLHREDIGFILKRYALALRQLGIDQVPEDTPFFDIYNEVKDRDLPVDPHDALEVLGRDATTRSPE